MARIRQGLALALSFVLLVAVTRAADSPAQPDDALFDRPVLVFDPDVHVGPIQAASTDDAGRWLVTGSADKTLRLWSAEDGSLYKTIRLPAGPGQTGEIFAVAINPDGTRIAVGGGTTGSDQPEQIYIFDRETGEIVHRVQGLPSGVSDLKFSRDGRLLAAILPSNGLRIYSAENWTEIASDEDYPVRAVHVAFAQDGGLATTSRDHKIRLYSGSLTRKIKPAATALIETKNADDGIAFSPDGGRIAVGYFGNEEADPAITILDGHSLAVLPRPDLNGISGGELRVVAWSRDGNVLFAAGWYGVVAWSGAGLGARRVVPGKWNTVSTLVPLPNGDLIVGDYTPILVRLEQDGNARWVHKPPTADFRSRKMKLSVSADGEIVDFNFDGPAEHRARFDLKTLRLTLDPPPNPEVQPPRQTGLPIQNWRSSYNFTFDGERLPMEPGAFSRSLAIDPAGDRFVIGTQQSLWEFDSKGTPIWNRTRVPGEVWEVNITGDRRLLVAAYNDGTIRWHRMSDGVELLAVMPLVDQQDWIAWTPEGYYASTQGAKKFLKWHVNHGWDGLAEGVPVDDIPGSFRADLLPLVLRELETPRALGLAELAVHNQQVLLRTHSDVSPGARLHLLTIGISAYNEEYAKNLRLNFAARDAEDLANAITSTQGALYAKIQPQILEDKDANLTGILRALHLMQADMAKGEGNDLAVIHFSGHGALVGEKLYLLPQNVDTRDEEGYQTTALSVDQLQEELERLAKYGRVLVLLDACHSGSSINPVALRAKLQTRAITVLTSSKSGQTSREDAKWNEHGAFTEVLIQALRDPAADPDHRGLITMTNLAHYVSTRVASLTNNAQTPDMDIQDDATIFAVGSQSPVPVH
jgi:WD40 repeat protein